ncbi:hypothetical protein BGZ59_001971 [Podila verticillata]|nr:hypothetical protein BGZ59_001971 [Podila verticillata]
MSSVKALVVGSANGDLRNMCSKVATINSKHGPFDILFCTGNFFDKETSQELIDEILENKLDFPITTYFIHGDNGVPGIIERRALRNHGEVCNNLFYLGSHGVMTTAQGVKIASLSGTYDSTVYTVDTEMEGFDVTILKRRYTKSDVDALISASKPASIMDTSKKGVDVFISHEWPSGILNEGNTPPQGLSPFTFSQPVARAAGSLQPRYHFAASSGTFWERSPYRNNDGAEHATRFIGLGDVGNKNKQRWFYAFNLVPLSSASDEVLQASITAATTACPLSNMELKRGPDESDNSFFWDNKRARGGPPDGYVCRRCNQPGHFVKDCTAERGVPEGYICKKCNQPGHFIRDCPIVKEEQESRATRGPPEGYVCNKCQQPGHFIKDCPMIAAEQQGGSRAPLPSQREMSRSSGATSGPKGATEARPCWFCLSSPDVDKNLIVSIGTEVYMTMAKGQLPETPSSLVPGGGHVLLITINHYPTFGSIEAEARSDFESELKKYKDGLCRFYESKGAVMVSWELSLGGKFQHAHTQLMAIPKDKVQAVEDQFRKDIGLFIIDRNVTEPGMWQDHVPSNPQDSFFKVELPSGKLLVCPVPGRVKVDAQFGRKVIATAMGHPSRADWKSCAKTSDEERKDTQAFKNAFKAYDFTL